MTSAESPTDLRHARHAEILAQLYEEQGFLVMSSITPCEIGSIHRASYDTPSTHRWPLRCVARSGYAEYAAQTKRMIELDGFYHPCPRQPGVFYYRVEPTD